MLYVQPGVLLLRHLLLAEEVFRILKKFQSIFTVIKIMVIGNIQTIMILGRKKLLGNSLLFMTNYTEDISIY